MTPTDPFQPVGLSGMLTRYVFIWLLLLGTIPISYPSRADGITADGVAVRTAAIGEFRFRYIDNEFGRLVLSRAESCYQNLSKGANHFFTDRLLKASADGSSERQIIAIWAHDSYLNIEFVSIELSGNTGRWQRTTSEQLNSLIFGEENDLATVTVPADKGELHPDVVKKLHTPLADLEFSPYRLDGFITHQSCFFLRVIEPEGSLNFLTLSGGGESRPTLTTYSDLVYTVFAAAN